MGHQVKTVCQICHADFFLMKISEHTRMIHNVDFLQYKEEFGSTYDHNQNKVYHRCCVCSDLVLLDSHRLQKHVQKHQMNFGEYTKQFNMVMVHEYSPNRLIPFKPRGNQTSKQSHNARAQKRDKYGKFQSDSNSGVAENIKF